MAFWLSAPFEDGGEEMKRLNWVLPRPGGLTARTAFSVALVTVSIGSVADMGESLAAGMDDKLQHMIAFAGLGLLGFCAMPARNPVRFTLPLLFAYGLLLECVQWHLPWREFSLLDVTADAVGLCLAFLLDTRVLRICARFSP